MSGADTLDRLTGAAIRPDAAAQFHAQGWPTRANEAWHYTDLNAVLCSFEMTLPSTDSDASASIELPDSALPRIVLVNGRHDARLSTATDYVSGFAGDVAHGEAEALPMVALNAAFAQDGIKVEIPAGVAAGTMLLVSHSHTARQDLIAPRNAVRLGPGASLTLVEVISGTGGYLHNPVITVTLEEGAVLHHYRLQDEALDAVHTSTAFVDIAAGAQYDSFTLNIGARLGRHEVHATLSGAQASVHLNAAQLLAGAQHGDVTTVVRHQSPLCSSRQTVKSVLADRARGVFQGRIEVARDAQKTDGYQMNHALLLSPDAEIDSKPELEIFADDVKCSHGATVGALDPEQIFYLRSRGIPEAEARNLLIRAFLDEALEPVADETARGLFEQAIGRWWQRERS